MVVPPLRKRDCLPDADAFEDLGEGADQLGSGDDQPFDVGLGRRDVEQRDGLMGGGNGVRLQGEMVSSSISSMRMPVWRRTSTAAQTQNAVASWVVMRLVSRSCCSVIEPGGSCW